MIKVIQNEYTPDFVFPPGETVMETLEAKGMTPAELANQLGYPLNTIAAIIKGEAAITSEIAIQLERVLGVSANFWNNLERLYRESLVIQQVGSAARRA